MPIVQFDGKLLFYAHIPKTAGTSVADLLARHGGTQQFYANLAHLAPKNHRLLNLPPQHVTAAHFDELFDASGFDGLFAFTRHPEERIVSEYRFRRAHGGIHAALSFSDWLVFITSAYREYPFLLEGHILPQNLFFVDGSKLFRLEDGFDGLINWLKLEFGIIVATETVIPQKNVSEGPGVSLFAEDRQLINEFYKDDFNIAGYDARDPAALPSAGVSYALKRYWLGRLGEIYALNKRNQ
ncbi:MAG: sulfotransferase family 2 domain-containing protein [Pseudomonadota bacterium]